jgi:hypothetical protein
MNTPYKNCNVFLLDGTVEPEYITLGNNLTDAELIPIFGQDNYAAFVPDSYTYGYGIQSPYADTDFTRLKPDAYIVFASAINSKDFISIKIRTVLDKRTIILEIDNWDILNVYLSDAYAIGVSYPLYRYISINANSNIFTFQGTSNISSPYLTIQHDGLIPPITIGIGGDTLTAITFQ